MILTNYGLDEYVFNALRAGASGFLVKDTEPADLLQALRVTMRGDALLSPAVTRRLISEFVARPADVLPAADLDLLTNREREVVALVAHGLSNDEIAERMVLSPMTAKTHVSRAMTKLGARDRAQLVVFAYQSGWSRPAPRVAPVPRTSFVTRYDFRAPGATPEERRELFARALEQAAYVDRHGHDALMLSEHHVSDDGYLPSPIPVAAAFAAVTERVPISIAALLVNLYDPLRLAEDIAVLDHLSGGRVSHTLGLGYRREEYDAVRRGLGDPRPRRRGADHPDARRLGHAARSPRRRSRSRTRSSSTAAARSRPRSGPPGSACTSSPRSAAPELKAAYEEECRAHGSRARLHAPRAARAGERLLRRGPGRVLGAYGHHLLADAHGYAAWRGGRHVVVRPSTTRAPSRRCGPPGSTSC